MNFRDLVTRLDLIEDAGLTLATVKAAEDAAKEKATVEKAKGGWTGFTSWDPKTAGNIAIAKLAQANRFEGLFNSDGDFIIAYGNNEWSSKEGQAPRTAPPTPEDWKPLASRGLIPSNAKGPAGLTSWLSGGKSDAEFKAARDQSAGVQASTGGDIVPKSGAADEPRTDQEKLEKVKKEIDQYLNPDKKVASLDDAPAVVASADGDTDDSEDDRAFGESVYKSLVESFGYQVEGTDAMGGQTGGSEAEYNKTPTPTQIKLAKSMEEFRTMTIVPGPYGKPLYDGEDLLMDLGLAALVITIGPFSEVFILPRLLVLAKRLEHIFVGGERIASKAAISNSAKNYASVIATSIKNNLGKTALATTAGGTMAINLVLDWIDSVKKGNNANFNPADLGKQNTSPGPAVDAMGSVTGASN